jgi:hypothetical protein
VQVNVEVTHVPKIDVFEIMLRLNLVVHFEKVVFFGILFWWIEGGSSVGDVFFWVDLGKKSRCISRVDM